MDAENENEEPDSGNSLGVLTPPTKNSTMGERIHNKESEIDAENCKVGSAPEKYLGELASPGLEEKRDVNEKIRKQEELLRISLKNNTEFKGFKD